MFGFGVVLYYKNNKIKMEVIFKIQITENYKLFYTVVSVEKQVVLIQEEVTPCITFNTNTIPEEEIIQVINNNFDLTPAGIIKYLDLRWKDPYLKLE